jgi:hypothetical protein
MKENTRTWMLAIGAASLMAFAGLASHLYPGIIEKTGLDLNGLGGVAVATLVLWLVLRRPQAITLRARIVLGVVAAVGLLVGLAVYFIS